MLDNVLDAYHDRVKLNGGAPGGCETFLLGIKSIITSPRISSIITHYSTNGPLIAS
jgi:hypothetical protein